MTLEIDLRARYSFGEAHTTLTHHTLAHTDTHLVRTLTLPLIYVLYIRALASAQLACAAKVVCIRPSSTVFSSCSSCSACHALLLYQSL
jgi:hypothetical protein